MKRFILSLGIAGAAHLAIAQAPFTIVRPADNAKVREDIRVLIPKNSVPKTGYVGFFLDGKFLQAVAPNLSGRYYEYLIDSKKTGMTDGKHNLEAVLYVDYSDEPRIVDRSSINVNVSNQANINIPREGLSIRYHFKPGQAIPYTVLQRIDQSRISVNAAALGDPTNSGIADYEKIRMIYNVDNVYDNGDALLRLQAEPLKNKTYAMYTPDGKLSPQVFWPEDMTPLYMRTSNTGNEVFGSVPDSLPFEGFRNRTTVKTESFYADWPLPTLPVKRVQPGDVWQTRFQVAKSDLKNRTAGNSIVDALPARGEFSNVEWEMGHPCAKIVNTIVSGPPNKKSGRVSMTETVWYAIDKKAVIKVVRDEQFDSAPSSAVGGGGVANPDAGQNNRQPAGGGGGIRRNRGGKNGGAGGGGGGGGGISLNLPPSSTTLMQTKGGGGGRRGGGGGRGAGALGGGDTGTGQRRGQGKGQGTQNRGPGRVGFTAAPTIGRLIIEKIFILDQ